MYVSLRVPRQTEHLCVLAAPWSPWSPGVRDHPPPHRGSKDFEIVARACARAEVNCPLTARCLKNSDDERLPVVDSAQVREVGGSGGEARSGRGLRAIRTSSLFGIVALVARSNSTLTTSACSSAIRLWRDSRSSSVSCVASSLAYRCRFARWLRNSSVKVVGLYPHLCESFVR